MIWYPINSAASISRSPIFPLMPDNQGGKRKAAASMRQAAIRSPFWRLFIFNNSIRVFSGLGKEIVPFKFSFDLT